METLKFSLEYKCYPIWYYDSEGCLVDNDLPEELLNDKDLDDLLWSIAKRYNTLFIDTPLEFSTTTFKTEKEKEDFINDVLKVTDILQNRYSQKYNIVISKEWTKENIYNWD